MFAQTMTRGRFAPPQPMRPTLAQLLTGAGLLAVGALMGLKLSPVLARWRAEQAAARIKPAPAEIDRWANEGGSVVPPAHQRRAGLT